MKMLLCDQMLLYVCLCDLPASPVKNIIVPFDVCPETNICSDMHFKFKGSRSAITFNTLT